MLGTYRWRKHTDATEDRGSSYLYLWDWADCREGYLHESWAPSGEESA